MYKDDIQIIEEMDFRSYEVIYYVKGKNFEQKLKVSPYLMAVGNIDSLVDNTFWNLMYYKNYPLKCNTTKDKIEQMNRTNYIEGIFELRKKIGYASTKEVLMIFSEYLYRAAHKKGK
jgi:hypothetical protein